MPHALCLRLADMSMPDGDQFVSNANACYCMLCLYIASCSLFRMLMHATACYACILPLADMSMPDGDQYHKYKDGRQYNSMPSPEEFSVRNVCTSERKDAVLCMCTHAYRQGRAVPTVCCFEC